MKKAIIFAVAALCVSVAQAVTTSWYSTHPTSNSSGTSAENLYSGARTEIAGVQLGLTDAGITDKVAISRVNFAINSSGNFIVNNNVMNSIYAQLICDTETVVKGVRAQLYVNDSSIKYSPNGTSGEAQAGSNKPYNGVEPNTSSGGYGFLSFDLDGVTLDPEKSYKLMFYTNEDCTTDTGTTVTLLEQSGITANKNIYLKADGTALSNAAALVWYEGTIVPEPTVLALLALGVAGLALKRKVA